MRKLTLLLAVFLSIFVLSCGGSSEKEATSEKPKQVEVKKYSIDTEEGMMKKLQEFKIDIPENLIFIDITKKSAGGRTVKFKSENVDEAIRKQLDEWYVKQIADMIADGWNKSKYGNTENVKTMGIVTSNNIFYKPKSGSSLKHAINFTSAYDIDEKTYTIYLSISEV